MKKLLIVLGSLLAVAAVSMLLRSRSAGEAIPEKWSEAAKEARSNLSDSVKSAAAVVKDKAAETGGAIKSLGESAADTANGAAKEIVSR